MTLVAHDVWFRHDRKADWVLQGAAIALEPGEVLGLQGPSGIGKSTLGRILAGLRTPQQGSVRTARGEITGPRTEVQYLAQDAQSAMNPRWRVEQVLAEAGPRSTGTDGVLVEELWQDRFPHEISGGQLQRVNLARALRARPGYLVADEITASLDALTQATVWRDLLSLTRAAGIGLLVISHDAALLRAVADRVVDFVPGGPTG